MYFAVIRLPLAKLTLHPLEPMVVSEFFYSRLERFNGVNISSGIAK